MKSEKEKTENNQLPSFAKIFANLLGVLVDKGVLTEEEASELFVVKKR
ncbi:MULTISPECIES: hypothetical protein [Bacillus]|nr:MULTISPECIES: hypothetical protein [Bacillus]MCS3600125.1 hypothetical protein [Bacillus sp. JUb91]MCU5181613.1 hypothetical protein [Bacillus toyonensis]